MQENTPTAKLSFKVAAPGNGESIISVRDALAVKNFKTFGGQVANERLHYGKGGAPLESITMNLIVPEHRRAEALGILSNIAGVQRLETLA